MKDGFKYDQQRKLLFLDEWRKYGFVAGFTTRKNGFSQPPYDELNLGWHVPDDKADVLKNREKVADLLEHDLSEWRCIQQLHGDRIIDLAKEDTQKAIHHEPEFEADGIFSKEPDDFLVTYYADCVPLYVIDPNTGYFGMAHAGWKGTVKEIGKKLVDQFLQKGSQLEDLHIGIGPSISQKHYEVNDVVADQIPPHHRERVLKPTTPGHYLLDLKTLNEELFLAAGIHPDRITKSRYCTFENNDLFFSYRRDQGKTGRMAAFIGVL